VTGSGGADSSVLPLDSDSALSSPPYYFTDQKWISSMKLPRCVTHRMMRMCLDIADSVLSERVPDIHGKGTGPGSCTTEHTTIYSYVLGQVRGSCVFSGGSSKTTYSTSFMAARCITGSPSARFSRSEESCLVNCVERFLDTSLFLVRKYDQGRVDHGRAQTIS